MPLYSLAQVATPEDVDPELTDIFSSEKEVVLNVVKAEEVSPYEVEVGVANVQSNFKQSGAGQQYDTESAPGRGYFFEVQKKVSENHFRFNANLILATFVEPDSIGSRKVSVSRKRFSMAYGKKYNSFFFEGGLGALFQDADPFTEYENLVSEYSSYGLVGSVRYEKGLTKTWSMHGIASSFVPVVFDEKGAQSGSYSYSYNVFASILFKAKLNRYFNLSFGTQFELEEHGFKGESERNISDAKLNYTAILFPVVVNYAF